MDGNKPSATRRSVETASGRISYTEQGTGPVALIVHGVPLNGHLWRHQLANLSDIRRSIAVDLLANGDTEIAPDQDVSLRPMRRSQGISRCLEHRSGGSGGQRQRRTYCADFRRIVSGAGPEPHAHRLRHPRQLVARGLRPFLAMAAVGGLRGTHGAMLS